MRVLLIISGLLLPSLILSAPLADFQCPSAAELAYPNPYDCSSYYVCINFVPHLMHCPPNLWYNPTLGVCDYKGNVDCVASPTPGVPTDPTTPEPTTAKPTTAKPSTAKPTTAKVTTIKPSTAKPTTVEPTTAKPTTAKPSTAKPTTAKVTTIKPTTAKVTTIKPTTVKPFTVRPIPSKPTTAESTTAEVTTVQPTTSKKTTTPESTTAEPTTTKPTTAEPTTSTTVKPTTSRPTTSEPKTFEPKTAKPSTAKPSSLLPTHKPKVITTPEPTPEPFHDGWYYIKTAIRPSDHYLTVATDQVDVFMTTWEPMRKDSQLWRLDDSNCLVNKAHPHMCLAPTGYKPWQKLMLRPKSHAYGPNWQKWRFEADGDSEYYSLVTEMDWSGEGLFGKLEMDVVWNDHVPLVGPFEAAQVNTHKKDGTKSQKFVILPA